MLNSSPAIRQNEVEVLTKILKNVYYLAKFDDQSTASLVQDVSLILEMEYNNKIFDTTRVKESLKFVFLLKDIKVYIKNFCHLRKFLSLK